MVEAQQQAERNLDKEVSLEVQMSLVSGAMNEMLV